LRTADLGLAQAMVESAPVFFCVVDAEGRIVSTNARLDDAIDLQPSETHGRLFWDVFSLPPEIDETRERIARAAAGGADEPHQAGLPTGDESERFVEWRDSVVSDEQGGVKWIVRAGLEISEQKRQETELRRAAEVQAALRIVATAVAAGPSEENLARIVTRQIAGLFRSQRAVVVKVDGQAARVIEGWTVSELPSIPAGRTIPLSETGTALETAIRTRAPARTDGGSGIWDELGIVTAVAAPIIVEGDLWGAVSTGRTAGAPFPDGVELRLADFAALVAQALANAAAREELTASRSRIVQAADEARRMLERDLHDGAQQRLVSLSISLRLAEAKVESAPLEARASLLAASEELAQAIAELRELARGIHPAVLTDRGIGPALVALAERSTVPVDVSNGLDERLSPAVEAAMYYVASESLANVAKHAAASAVAVSVGCHDRVAFVEVTDDGLGGADPRGSGLRGLADRVEALGGRLRVAPGEPRGTRISAVIPLP
jgi:PAS domain S-box-containing protein